jgi:hypothetical protein
MVGYFLGEPWARGALPHLDLSVQLGMEWNAGGLL